MKKGLFLKPVKFNSFNRVNAVSKTRGYEVPIMFIKKIFRPG